MQKLRAWVRSLVVAGAFVVLSAAGSTDVFSQQPSTGVPDLPRPTDGIPGGSMAPSDMDFVKWILQQGGLTIVCVFMYLSQRKDAAKRLEEVQAEREKERLRLEGDRDKERTRTDEMRTERKELSSALQSNAIAVQANTELTRQLAHNVALLERRSEPRP